MLNALEQLRRRSRFLVVLIASDEVRERHVKRLWDKIASLPFVGCIDVNKVR